MFHVLHVIKIKNIMKKFILKLYNKYIIFALAMICWLLYYTIPVYGILFLPLVGIFAITDLTLRTIEFIKIIKKRHV